MSLSRRRRKIVGRLHRRRTREREGLVLVEGVRGVEEALGAGARPRFLLRSPRGRELWTPRLQSLVGEADLEMEEVSDREMAEAADTDTPQGVLLVVEEPRPEPASVWGAADARILLLDGIQDPGNVGTLVRVAAAFDCTAVVALDGTADVWGPKAVRAAAGTCFRIPVVHAPWPRVDPEWEASGLALWVADAGGAPVSRVDPGAGWVLALGGEANGCRREVVERSRGAVSVPMPGGVESLNVGVAGAILLYDLSREDRR